MNKVILVIIVLFLSLLIRCSGRFALQLYVVKSGSMEPAIKTGSIVCLEKQPADQLKAGDIVGFKAGDAIVVHRIRNVYGDSEQLLTKGDNNECVDIAPVPFEAVIGKVVLTVPYVGYAAVWLRAHAFKICAFSLFVFTFGVLLKKIRKDQCKI